MRVAWLPLIGILLSASVAEGAELHQYYRGARTQAMGGAFTALADDEQAVFLNPAGLAGNKRFGTVFTLNTEAAVTILSAMDALGNLSAETVSSLLGKNLYARGQATPTVIMPNFGVSVLVDAQAAIYSRNAALPQMTLGYQNTNGLQVAYGYSFSKRRSRFRGDLRIGIGAKMLWRRGGYKLLGPLQIADLSTRGQAALGGLVGAFAGPAYGVDLGMQYVHAVNGDLTLLGGAAYLNAGDVTFGGDADPLKGDLSAGIAMKYRMDEMDVVIAYDYRNILQDADWRKKSHFGMEFRFPLLSLYAGLHQVYLTGGVTFDAWLTRITAVTYAEELGSFAHQESNRRYMLSATIKFDL